MNVVSLIGRLVKDLDLRYTQSGKAVATGTLAVNRRFKNASGENEAANYDETYKQRREKERLEREEKAIVSEKENLKRLIAKYPELAKQAVAKEEPTC